jgi:hypothetical protein
VLRVSEAQITKHSIRKCGYSSHCQTPSKCMPLDVRRQLDSIPRLTDDVNLHSGATYIFLAPPFLYDYPQYFTSGRLPNGVGGIR